MTHVGPHFPFMIAGVLALIALGGLIVWLVIHYRRPAAIAFTPSVSSDTGAGAPDMGTPPDVERDMLLMIPDITGYTAFIDQSRFALRHAQFVVSELLDAMADAVTGRLRLCMPEGDALLLYAPLDDGSDATRLEQAVIDLVAAFYRRRSELVCGNGCPCPVCNSIEGLDLKVIVHRGAVLESVVAGHHALSGMPAVEAHRLLKNDVGRRHYVLVTQAAQPLFTQLRRASGEPYTAPAQDGIEPLAAFVHRLDDVADAAAQSPQPATVERLVDACRKLRSNLKDLPIVGTET